MKRRPSRPKPAPGGGFGQGLGHRLGHVLNGGGGRAAPILLTVFLPFRLALALAMHPPSQGRQNALRGARLERLGLALLIKPLAPGFEEDIDAFVVEGGPAPWQSVFLVIDETDDREQKRIGAQFPQPADGEVLLVQNPLELGRVGIGFFRRLGFVAVKLLVGGVEPTIHEGLDLVRLERLHVKLDKARAQVHRRPVALVAAGHEHEIAVAVLEEIPQALADLDPHWLADDFVQAVEDPEGGLTAVPEGRAGIGQRLGSIGVVSFADHKLPETPLRVRVAQVAQTQEDRRQTARQPEVRRDFLAAGQQPAQLPRPGGFARPRLPQQDHPAFLKTSGHREHPGEHGVLGVPAFRQLFPGIAAQVLAGEGARHDGAQRHISVLDFQVNLQALPQADQAQQAGLFGQTLQVGNDGGRSRDEFGRGLLRGGAAGTLGLRPLRREGSQKGGEVFEFLAVGEEDHPFREWMLRLEFLPLTFADEAVLVEGAAGENRPSPGEEVAKVGIGQSIRAPDKEQAFAHAQRLEHALSVLVVLDHFVGLDAQHDGIRLVIFAVEVKDAGGPASEPFVNQGRFLPTDGRQGGGLLEQVVIVRGGEWQAQGHEGLQHRAVL